MKMPLRWYHRSASCAESNGSSGPFLEGLSVLTMLHQRLIGLYINQSPNLPRHRETRFREIVQPEGELVSLGEYSSISYSKGLRTLNCSPSPLNSISVAWSVSVSSRVVSEEEIELTKTNNTQRSGGASRRIIETHVEPYHHYQQTCRSGLILRAENRCLSIKSKSS